MEDNNVTVVLKNNITYTPKVSVIVPVYNVEQYLRQCLDSIINQSLKEIEIICINDSSTDNSLEILKDYANNDNRFLILNQNNSGGAIARTNALKYAKGEYIGFVDSDDWIDNNYYELLYNEAKKQNADIARTTYKYIYPTYEFDEKSLSKKLIKKHNEKQDLSVNDHGVVIWDAIYKTSMLKNNNIDYFDNITGAHDVPFTARATFYSKKSIPVTGTYYNYRKNVVNQLSNFTLKRINYIITSNKITINFINSVNYDSIEDYIVAYKRCLWRYNDAFIKGLKLPDFTEKPQRELFNEMVKAIKKCKYQKELLKNYNEIYYKRLIRNDFKGYVKSINRRFINNLIVSLTSYPARINTVEQTIESLLTQTIKARNIVLWLAPEQFPKREKDLPSTLLMLQEKGLIIDWYQDIKSYKKLIPTLQKYPNDIIVTADDDIVYKEDWLENLINAFKNNPNLIHCHRAHRITFDDNKQIKPYKEWEWDIKNVSPSFNNFFTGAGGVLYPPNSLYKDVLNIELFKKLAPFADDIWFWAMAVLNNTKINVIKKNNSKLEYVEDTQKDCLWQINITGSKNDEQLSNVLKYYPQILKKLDKKKFKRPSELSFITRLFSITNLPSKNDKWYKVIYILGLKFSFRNKKKEEKMKLLKESENK